MGDVISFFLFQPPSIPTHLPRSKYFWIETERNSVIPAFYITHPEATRTILYSHGNAEDLGMIYDYLRDVSRVLKVNIFSYDYTGYGLSTNRSLQKCGFGPSEECCYADIDAAYKHLLEVVGLPPEKIILYGRSLGGGPSCYLAARTTREGKCVGGLILHSAFSSVFRVVVNMGCTAAGDLFSNVDNIKDVGCHVYIMHGTIDEVVPFSHGKELYEATPDHFKTVPFWAEGMGHNNIEADMPHAFIKRLHKFLKFLEKKEKEDEREKKRIDDMQEESIETTMDLMSQNIKYMNLEKQKLADIESKIKDIKMSFWNIVDQPENDSMLKICSNGQGKVCCSTTLSSSWSSDEVDDQVEVIERTGMSQISLKTNSSIPSESAIEQKQEHKRSNVLSTKPIREYLLRHGDSKRKKSTGVECGKKCQSSEDNERDDSRSESRSVNSSSNQPRCPTSPREQSPLKRYSLSRNSTPVEKRKGY